MIGRYSRPEMAGIWTEDAKLQRWLDVELAVCRAWSRRGVVPAEDLAEIEAKAAFSVERTLEIERTTNHDVVAFLTDVAEHIGPASRWVHYGMTSSDVLDTGARGRAQAGRGDHPARAGGADRDAASREPSSTPTRSASGARTASTPSRRRSA